MYKKDLVSKIKVVEGAKFKLEGTSDYGNEIVNYDEPKKYYFNVMPLKTASEIQAFGELATSK